MTYATCLEQRCLHYVETLVLVNPKYFYCNFLSSCVYKNKKRDLLQCSSPIINNNYLNTSSSNYDGEMESQKINFCVQRKYSRTKI